MREALPLHVWAPFLAFLLLMGPAAAMELDARADRTEVDLDGRVTVTLSVRGGQGEASIDLGSTAGFRVYSSGTSQSISIVNGQVSSSLTYTYLFFPSEKGEFAVGPFRATQGGEEATAAAIPIRVVEASVPVPEPRPRPEPRPERGRGEKRDVFLRTSLDKREVYVGEPVTLTFRLYTRIRFAGDPQYEPPSTEGFWKEDLPPQQRFYAEVDGHRFLVTEVKTALFPTRAGRLVVGPARLAYEEDVFFSSDPFDLLRGGMGRRRPVRETLETDSLVVRVNPLPEKGRPPDFGGAVGSFTLQAMVDKNETGANEPVTLTLTVEGEGNIQAATLPESRVPDSFKVYDSGSSTETSKEGYRVRGRKTYTRVLVPRYGGDYEVAPVSFSYFDPQRETYVTRTAGPFPIRVEGPPPEEEWEQREIARVEEDIRYLKEPDDPRWTTATAAPPIRALAAGNLVPLVLLGALFIARKRRERYERDPVWARARRADRAARRLLSEARRRLADEDSREFAASLSRGVVGFLADKGNIAAAGMTRREIDRELERRGFPPDLRERLSKLLDASDRARFSADPEEAGERRRLLAEAEELLRLFGKRLSGRKR
ncbi:MAG: BatD family protein [Candidatus Eisenbacteria bacterium]